jgi:outer membrane protein OmpA-like peptidoglycan-associated protein
MVRGLSLAVLLAFAATAVAAEFGNGIGGAWEFSASEARCTLQQPVGDYGVARFSGEKGRGLHFEVLGHRELFADGAVQLLRVAPPWHSQYPLQESIGELSHRGGSGVRVADPVATQVLMSLYNGFDTRLQHASWYVGGPSVVAIQISSVGIRALYEDFIHCAQGAPIVGWAEVEKTRITYATNGSELSPDTTEQLHQVARFVQGDPWVTGVFVDGHTDSLGTQKGNYLLSKQRAEVVRECLADAGVDSQLLTVRFHGAAYPVGDNESEAGRALNRRTTVRLERLWPQLEGPKLAGGP